MFYKELKYYFENVSLWLSIFKMPVMSVMLRF